MGAIPLGTLYEERWGREIRLIKVLNEKERVKLKGESAVVAICNLDVRLTDCLFSY